MSYEESFGDLLDNLCDEKAPLRAALIYRLSEPLPEELAILRARWNAVPVERRRLLLSRLVDMSEVSFEVDYSAVALFALEDEDDEVRSSAIEALWTNDEPATMRRLIQLLQTDAAASVRAAAASALGRFVLAGALNKFPEALTREIEAVLLEAWDDREEEIEVRRRALESIAYSDHDEVPAMIEEAAQHSDLKMQASALFAMGRSADERWASSILGALDHPEPELRFEAARAAGELGLSAAVPRLAAMVEDPDREIKEAAIWSLGEIGGAQARRVLMALAERHDMDEALLDVVEDALNVAVLSTGEFATYLFTDSRDIDEDEDEAILADIEDGLYDEDDDLGPDDEFDVR